MSDYKFGWWSFVCGMAVAAVLGLVFEKDGERICREVSLVLPDQMALLKDKKVCR